MPINHVDTDMTPKYKVSDRVYCQRQNLEGVVTEVYSGRDWEDEVTYKVTVEHKTEQREMVGLSLKVKSVVHLTKYTWDGRIDPQEQPCLINLESKYLIKAFQEIKVKPEKKRPVNPNFGSWS